MSHPAASTVESLQSRYEEARARKLDLDLTRGKPSTAQLDLSAELLGPLDGYRSADGTDCRNYGGPDGLPEMKQFFADVLGVRADEVLVGDNASLSLMHDVLAQACLRGVPGGSEPWSNGASFLCPVPGYDRHFGICEYLGIDMVPVPMTDEGPDMAIVSEIAGSDDRVKGIFCVPRYSNPTGITYSADTVEALARLETAAPDFRIIWDNAYAVHHLYDDPEPLADILTACRRAGCPERPVLFASTSKITLAGAGSAAAAADGTNLADLRFWRSKQSIGPDKINQLRHLRFLPDRASLEAHMWRHADLLRPKFETVLEILEEDLGGTGCAEWSKPRGGYFINVDVHEGCAAEIVDLAAGAGVRLTPAGATFPYGRDPRDRNIRLAPSFPPPDELEQATRILALSILLVSHRHGLVS